MSLPEHPVEVPSLPTHLTAPDDMRNVTRLERRRRQKAFGRLREELRLTEEEYSFTNGQHDFGWRVSTGLYRLVTVLNNHRVGSGEQAYRVILNNFIRNTVGEASLEQTVHVQDYVLLKDENLIAAHRFSGGYTLAARWNEHIMAPPVLDDHVTPHLITSGVGYEPPEPTQIRQNYLGINVFRIHDEVERMHGVVSSARHSR